MNRTRTLLVLGVFMLSLAVLAALEFRVQDEAPTEGQMVTGSLSKDVPALPKLPSLTDSDGKGVLVPLDNGTLRDGGSPLDVTASAPAEPASPAAPAAPEPEKAAPAVEATPPEAPQPPVVGEIAPPETFAEKPETAPVAEAKVKETVKPVEKTTAEPPMTAKEPKKAKGEKAPEKQDGAVVLTTKAPAKLAAGQTAISATRLELGKSVVFRMTGAAPIKTKTLLLTGPDRYVVDLQGKWGIQLPRVPKDLWISGIRLGHHEDSTRLVFELTRTPESAKVVKINDRTVEVRIR